MTEIEPRLMAVLINRMFLPPEQRDEKAVTQALEGIKSPLKVLDDTVKSHPYLLGNDFTIADLNVAGVMLFAAIAKIDFSAVPAAQAWLNNCLGREAGQKARAQK